MLSSGEDNDGIGIFKVARTIRTKKQETEYVHYIGNFNQIYIITCDSITCEGVGEIPCAPGIPDDNQSNMDLIGYTDCFGNCN